jgi:photosystem II stability/assembly factor-like uncharacterized protein
MPHRYHFAQHKNGTQFEDLGAITLADDAEALAFGKRLTQDLMRVDPEHYADWTMDLTAGERKVGSIRFEFDTDDDFQNPEPRTDRAAAGS